MSARNHEELICWQLATQFRDRVNEILARPIFKRRYKYCDQLHDAAESIPSNISEGFYKYSHPEMARYFGIALGSLGEAQTLGIGQSSESVARGRI